VRRFEGQLRQLDSRGGRRVASIWPGSLERCADSGTSCTRIAFDITIEPSLPSIDPVRSFVVINPRPCTHEAKEDMFRWPDHNSHMPAPHDQVARLRVRDPLKPLDAGVEIVGAGVDIGKTGAFVNRMHQVRTIVSCIATHFRVERSRDHAQTVVRSECPNRVSCVASTRARRRGV
jgi:hypothetical protein